MATDTLLLALSGTQLEAVARYLRHTTTSRETMILLLFAVIIGAIWTTIFLWDRLRRSAEAAQVAARTLFDELCLAHRLTGDDVALLQTAAQACRLDSPASLFARPDPFDALCLDSQPKAEAYRHLRDRLFGKLG